MKTSAFVATSLDGYIARGDGSIDWLNEANNLSPEGEDCGYKDFMDTVDALIMVRKTFEQVLTFGEWAYGETPVIVMSRNTVKIPEHLKETVSHSSEPPSELLNRLELPGMNHVYVDGGRTIQSFLEDSCRHSPDPCNQHHFRFWFCTEYLQHQKGWNCRNGRVRSYRKR